MFEFRQPEHLRLRPPRMRLFEVEQRHRRSFVVFHSFPGPQAPASFAWVLSRETRFADRTPRERIQGRSRGTG